DQILYNIKASSRWWSLSDNTVVYQSIKPLSPCHLSNTETTPKLILKHTTTLPVIRTTKLTQTTLIRTTLGTLPRQGI
ncbi:hypothetical protein SERLADRAFT_463698, partial [Serpula lacrymans var. lacrymans S7.9]